MIERAIRRSADNSSFDTTFDILPASAKLNVPISPKAKQNLFRDCTKPTEAIIAGISAKAAELEFALVRIKYVAVMRKKVAPILATCFLRFTSAPPILQTPA